MVTICFRKSGRRGGFGWRCFLFQKIGQAGAVTVCPVSENGAVAGMVTGGSSVVVADLCYLFQKIGVVEVVTWLQTCVTCFRKARWLK